MRPFGLTKINGTWNIRPAMTGTAQAAGCFRDPQTLCPPRFLARQGCNCHWSRPPTATLLINYLRSGKKPSCNTSLYSNTIQKTWIFCKPKHLSRMLFILTKSCFKIPCLVFANVNGLPSSIQTMKAKKSYHSTCSGNGEWKAGGWKVISLNRCSLVLW